MADVVYLFVDTNLLIQCLPLEQLDWSIWSAFNEVKLIVSSPVLREIDYRKNKSNDRVGKRARASSSMFRKISNDGYKLVRDSGPRVKLTVEAQHQQSKELEERLNYQERDDQLVGTVYQFVKSNPGTQVRLLTHDTTPRFTASSLGLVVEDIPDDWLLPPENSETEKELAALKAENARLKKAEPNFAIQCLDSAGAEINRYEISCTRYEPLTDAEISTLRQHLKEHFPLETDFGSRESAERDRTLFGNVVRASGYVYTPPTDEEIAKYRDETYPQWLKRCEEVLSNYHLTLQRQAPIPRLEFLAENCGTRPASDALITIEAKGNFQIKPLVLKEDDEDDTGDEGENHQKNHSELLPSPPSVPSGSWQKKNSRRNQHLSDTFATLAQAIARSAGDIHQYDAVRPLVRVPDLSNLPHRRDPNAFYYKPDRPQMPQDFFCLECDQWRHEDGGELFDAEIHFPIDLDEVEGVLICRIQAGNLSKSVSKKIPVRITTTQVSSFERAKAIVETLVGCP